MVNLWSINKIGLWSKVALAWRDFIILPPTIPEQNQKEILLSQINNVSSSLSRNLNPQPSWDWGTCTWCTLHVVLSNALGLFFEVSPISSHSRSRTVFFGQWDLGWISIRKNNNELGPSAGRGAGRGAADHPPLEHVHRHGEGARPGAGPPRRTPSS